MPIYTLNGRNPVIGPHTWVAPSAFIIGNVTIGSRCWIGPGAVIRGDFGEIVIGDETAIEDGAVLHTPTRLTIGRAVTVGHMAMVHGARVGDYAVIGMNSTLGDNAQVGEWSIVAEHSLIKKNQVVPGYRLYAGSPAVEKGEIDQRYREVMLLGKQMYIDLVAQYLSSMEEMG